MKDKINLRDDLDSVYASLLYFEDDVAAEIQKIRNSICDITLRLDYLSQKVSYLNDMIGIIAEEKMGEEE